MGVAVDRGSALVGLDMGDDDALEESVDVVHVAAVLHLGKAGVYPVWGDGDAFFGRQDGHQGAGNLCNRIRRKLLRMARGQQRWCKKGLGC